MVEERRRHEHADVDDSLRTAAALKDVANSAAYGIHVELNRHEPTPQPSPGDMHGLDLFESQTNAIEEPGEYFFPPHAALITGGARLMVTLLEQLVGNRDGTWAFCDTDSAAIVATEHGGLISCPGGPERGENGRHCVRALSWAQVDEIIGRFAALNPYDTALVPSILELEPENRDPQTGERRQLHCYAISAKRYVLYTVDPAGEPELVKRSEHALGAFYLDPLDPDQDGRDWVDEIWRLIIREDGLGLPATEPSWLDRPAPTRFTASHPRLLKPFATLNHGKPYQEQIKPANFLLVAHVAPGGHPSRRDPKRFALIAPSGADPRTWARLEWRNVHDPAGSAYAISTETRLARGGRPLPAAVVGVKSYRDVLDAYRVNPEPKSLGPDGRPCTRLTIGLLTPRRVEALTIAHIGKESNLLDEIQAGLIGDQDEVLTEYVDTRRDPWNRLLPPILVELPVARLVRETGLDATTIKRIRRGKVQPSPRSRTLLLRSASTHAREELGRLAEEKPERDDLIACSRYLQQPPRADMPRLRRPACRGPRHVLL